MRQEQPKSGLLLLGMLGASEAEIPILAELHRNPRLHIVGIYDNDPLAMGMELAEILGIPTGSGEGFLSHLATAQQVVLPRDRHRLRAEIEALRQLGVVLIDAQEALAQHRSERIVEAVRPVVPPRAAEEGAQRLEDTLRWLNRALDREELLRSMLSIGLQAVGGDKGSIQILDPLTQDLFIGYAEGLSDQVVRTSRQKLGEGIAGGVAATRRGRLLHGQVHRQVAPERSEILSAICVPLVVEDQLLGVLNVATELGSKPFVKSDLTLLEQLARRMAPVIQRLLEIQAEHERSVVDDLQHELEGLLRMDLDPLQTLGVMRDLLQDVSGARSAQLLVLTPDGTALSLRPRDSGGELRVDRENDIHSGILGQVLLGREPVILEERVRLAGETLVRRHLTLYLPLGEPEAIAMLIAHFEGLAVLSHFQRNMESVQRVLTPRLLELLVREDRRGRMERLRRLVHGLSAMGQQTLHESAALAAEVLRRQSEAQAVAVWLDDSSFPSLVINEGLEVSAELELLWPRLHAMLARGQRQRLREVDEEGSRLRSLLLVGDVEGMAFVALNRQPRSPLEESGFRDEDEEAALALLATLGARSIAVAPALPTAAGESPDFAQSHNLLLDALRRELERAKRYHFGFSLTLVQVTLDASQWQQHGELFRHRLAANTRSTDCVLWLSAGRFAMLAPEEARGQRRLARRIENVLLELLSELDLPETDLRSGNASFPQHADDAESLLAGAEAGLQSGSIDNRQRPA